MDLTGAGSRLVVRIPDARCPAACATESADHHEVVAEQALGRVPAEVRVGVDDRPMVTGVPPGEHLLIGLPGLWRDDVPVRRRLVVECGGKVGDDGVIAPTVLSGVTPDMKVSCAEVFGPVVGIATYTDYEDALASANDTIYGLHAAVFTNDLGRALRAAEVLDFAGVMVNEVPAWRADQMPYGGIRESGNTREGPVYAVQEMTEERLIVIQA